MKKLSMFIAITMFSSIVYARKINKSEIPPVVKAAVSNRYPQAGAVKWEKEDGNYEAAFKQDKREYALLLDPSGNILETEVEIDVTALPKEVRNEVTKRYPGKKIKEASQITDAKGIVTFEAEISGTDVLFDERGNFIKESKD